MRCRSLEEAIEIGNDVAYGLSASIYTRDVNKAFTAMRDMYTGIFYVNAPTIGAEVHLPFGGTKATGNGHREAGTAALDVFSEWKSIYVDFSGPLERGEVGTWGGGGGGEGSNPPTHTPKPKLQNPTPHPHQERAAAVVSRNRAWVEGWLTGGAKWAGLRNPVGRPYASERAVRIGRDRRVPVNQLVVVEDVVDLELDPRRTVFQTGTS